MVATQANPTLTDKPFSPMLQQANKLNLKVKQLSISQLRDYIN